MTNEQPASSAEVVGSLLDGTESFAVTGASGWFGRAALDILLRTLGRRAFAERVHAYASTAKTVTLRDGTAVAAESLEHLPRLCGDVSHMLHFAFLTRDRVGEFGVDAYVSGNLEITDVVLHALESASVRGFAYASSGARLRTQGARSGGSVRQNPYGALKRIDELAFRQACADIGASSCIARVFGTSGPYMTKADQFAMGDFILTALRNEPLRIRATNQVFRSYTGIEDIVGLQLAAILRPGRHDDVFDTGGEIVEVGELARRVLQSLGREGLPVERPTIEPADAGDRYVGDPARMSELAGRLGVRLATLDEQILATATWLAECREAETLTEDAPA